MKSNGNSAVYCADLDGNIKGSNEIVTNSNYIYTNIMCSNDAQLVPLDNCKKKDGDCPEIITEHLTTLATMDIFGLLEYMEDLFVVIDELIDKINHLDDIVTCEDVENIAKTYLSTLENMEVETIEMAFFGGSFTAIETKKQTALLESAYEFVKSGIIDGIRLSTSPDYINDEIVSRLV